MDTMTAALATGYEQDVTEVGIRELLKSMEANEGISDVAALQGASALQPQSLDGSVVSLLFDESYFKILNRIPRDTVYSTLVEYTQRTSYGRFNRGGFMGQAENPRQADPNFKRRVVDIKFLRELWSVSSVLAASRTITNAEVEAVDAATLRLMETAETAYFFGDSSVIPEEWDGLLATVQQQGTSDQIIDLRGAGFTERILKDSCKGIAQRTGLANDMYVSYNVQNQIDNILGSDQQRYMQNDGSLTYDLGYIIPGFRATFAKSGRVTFVPDIFLNEEEEGVPTVQDASGNVVEGSTSDLAPSVPGVGLTPIVSGSLNPGEDSQWSATGVAPGGVSYDYRVASVSRHGASKASVIVQATPPTGGAMDIEITDNSVANFADGFIIYRIVKTGAQAGLIRKMIRISKGAGAVTTHRDLNDDLPGTSTSFLGDFNSRGADGPMRTTRIRELTPFHKTRYSTIGPFFWGATNWYATPIFDAPQKFVIFKNVGID